MENLFRWGKFILASGKKSNFKLECDALTVSDWETVAQLIYMTGILPSQVIGVPSGGMPLQYAFYRQKLLNYCMPTVLVVDDVYTTGGSIRKYLQDENGVMKPNHKGFVLFSRVPKEQMLPNVKAVFYMDGSNLWH